MNIIPNYENYEETIHDYGEIVYWAFHTHPVTRNEMLVFGKRYLRYAATDKKFQFMFLQQDCPFKTFQEILQDEFDGELDEAMNEFLKPEFYNTTLQEMAEWMLENGMDAVCDMEMLCVMKWFVINSNLDDLKELLELEMPSLK
jgi:hypothetical protein